jgi:hypothetical protein
MAGASGDTGVSRYNEDMAAAFIVETEMWDQTKKLFASEASGEGDSMASHAAHNAGQMSARMRRNLALPVFIRGLAAAKTGSPEAEKAVQQLQSIRKQMADGGNAYAAKSAEIMELEVAAVLASSKNKNDEAIEMMKRATAIEEEMSPPSGPPSLIKPSHELLGELLLGANRPKEAAAQFRKARLRYTRLSSTSGNKQIRDYLSCARRGIS